MSEGKQVFLCKCTAAIGCQVSTVFVKSKDNYVNEIPSPLATFTPEPTLPSSMEKKKKKIFALILATFLGSQFLQNVPKRVRC